MTADVASDTYEAFDLVWVFDEAKGDFVVERRNVRLVERKKVAIRKTRYERLASAAEKRSDLPAPQVIRDIEPYRAVASDVAAGGERPIIGGRAEHREFLKRNGYVEVGNDFTPPKPMPELPPVAQDVKRAMEDASLRAEAMAATKKAKEAVAE